MSAQSKPRTVKRLEGVPDLVGWKSIAAFLRISVRNAQRFASHQPPPGHSRMPVAATIWGTAAWSDELAIWAKYRMHSHAVDLALDAAARVTAQTVAHERETARIQVRKRA